MRLDRVTILNLRNIEFAEFEPGPGVNWLVGDNGAGKTSVLEGIYMLARGNSFRLSRARPVIKRGSVVVRVHAHGAKDSGERYSVGVERTPNSYRARVNGQPVNRLSDLAIGLPLQIVNANSFHILDRGPSFRRRLLDWGVFHVEHAYKDWYADYDRALRQRNSSLRSGRKDFWVWDSELGRNGEKISASRRKYTVRFLENFSLVRDQVPGLPHIVFRYSQGWPTGESLGECLARCRQTDERRGYTTTGIHTGDLEILIDGRPAVEVLSRGEQKLLIVLIHFAQGRAIQRYAGETPIMLLDDLPAELDEGKRSAVLRLLREGGLQCFLSAVDPRDSDTPVTSKDRMFHVEHGRILV